VTTTFRYEHVFDAPDPAALFAIYFDPDHVAVQDAATGISSREVLDLEDTGTELRRVCRVTPRRQLPAFMRPFFPGALHYVEQAIWRRPLDQIDIEVRPSLLGGRAQITSTYHLQTDGPGLVRRTYAGSVSVEVALVGGRIERGIVSDIDRSLAISGRCTQDHLDRRGQVPTSRMTGSATGT